MLILLAAEASCQLSSAAYANAHKLINIGVIAANADTEGIQGLHLVVPCQADQHRI